MEALEALVLMQDQRGNPYAYRRSKLLRAVVSVKVYTSQKAETTRESVSLAWTLRRLKGYIE